MNPLDKPDFPWLDRLRRGHWVFLSKEKIYASVSFAWEPPEPGSRAGRIAINRVVENRYQGTEVWYATIYGEGVDGSQILLPVEDNLPDEPSPISNVWQRHVERTLAVLRHDVDEIQAALSKILMRMAISQIFGKWRDDE